MTTNTKFKVVNFIGLFFLAASIGFLSAGYFYHSSRFWTIARLLGFAAVILMFLTYPLQKRLVQEKRKKRDETGMPID